ncbi:MAG: response regulator [Bacillota bacterium]
MIVFLAEDNPGDILLIKEAFIEAGIDVQYVIKMNGELATNYVREIEKNYETLPDMIILDLNLPFKNGFEILSVIKQNDKLKHIPAIVFTSSTNDEDKERAKQLGAAGYFSKPVNYMDYITTVKHFLSIMHE